MSDLTTSYALLPVLKYENGAFSTGEDKVIKEVPVNLIVNGFEFSTMTCSPYNVKEMAAGFLYSEGLVQQSEDIKNITIDDDGQTVRVETTNDAVNEGNFVKRLVTTSCSKGGPSLYFFNSAKRVAPVNTGNKLNITPAQIFTLCDAVEEMTPLFSQTGGSHSAAICTTEQILYTYEDVGRHNATDKVLGRCILDKVDMSDKLIVFSGRIASEILIKIAKMGIPMIAARSSPTELAVNLAQDFGITIVGFVRTNRLTVYTNKHRIIQD